MRKILCDKCGLETNHEVVRSYEVTYTPKEYPDMEIDFAKGTFEIVKCMGCEEVSFREIWITSEDINPFTDELEEYIKLYPERSKGRRSIKSIRFLPGELETIYVETIRCFNNGSYLLCAAGLRAVIEGICAERGVKCGRVTLIRKNGTSKTVNQKNLEGKINGLSEAGILTKDHTSTLHELRFIGNEALHELQSVKPDELSIGLDIIEHTLENLYGLPIKRRALSVRKTKSKTKP